MVFEGVSVIDYFFILTILVFYCYLTILILDIAMMTMLNIEMFAYHLFISHLFCLQFHRDYLISQSFK